LKTQVVHCKKSKFDVYIGRPSKYGNPFSHKEDTLAQFKTSTKEESLQRYKEWLLSQPSLISEMKVELKGKILGCWCSPARCHGDIIIEVIENKRLF
jgi:hypothetical protein